MNAGRGVRAAPRRCAMRFQEQPQLPDALGATCRATGHRPAAPAVEALAPEAAREAARGAAPADVTLAAGSGWVPAPTDHDGIPSTAPSSCPTLRRPRLPSPCRSGCCAKAAVLRRKASG
jgi:hypothetical protein